MHELRWPEIRETARAALAGETRVGQRRLYERASPVVRRRLAGSGVLSAVRGLTGTDVR